MNHFSLIGICILLSTMDAQALEAGAAKVDITAPIGTPLNGYGDRMGRNSESIHDPIWSRALYLDDGDTRLFLVSVDLVAVNPELRARVLELAPEVVPQDNIILCATHTHSGQGAMVRSIPIRFVSGRFMPEVLESTAQGIAESMRNAYEKRKRAALGYATGKHSGLSVNRRNSGGPVDEQIGVILVEDADGNPISLVTNFTAHPTSVGDPDFYAFSADYPGFYYLEVESLLGPDCVPLFLNGALGNQTIGNPEGKHGWERTESVGRLLARQAVKISRSASFSDARLRVAHQQARLPYTLLTAIQPESVFLQSLEINDLLLSLFPGEACVELGLNLRSRALGRGYDAHFSVGLSNDYIMYFVPRHLYPEPSYESTSSFFGPGIEDWFYEHFESMMRVPEGFDEALPSGYAGDDAQEATPLVNGLLVELAGTPHEIGIARGNLFVADIQQQYESRIVDAVVSGRWLPESGPWSFFPPFLDVPALALPMLGTGSRGMLRGITLDLIREMEGIAEGSRLAFDAFWLLQNAPMYETMEDKGVLFSSPLCTMFAVVGERAGADDLVVGRNLDWPLSEQAVVTRVRPDVGHAFMQVGFSWNAGIFTGVNDGGLMLCVERLRPETERPPDRAPVEFLLRDLIQLTDSFDAAVAALMKATHLRDVHVLVAGFEEKKPKAAVVEYGSEPRVRYPDDSGLLLGVKPETANAPESTAIRYERLAERLADVRIISELDARRALTEADVDDGLDRIWNHWTRHSAVFLNRSRTLHVAFADEAGLPGDFTTLTFEGDATHE